VVQHLVALLIALIELAEAEADRLKLGVRKLLVAGALVVVGASVGAAMLVAASALLLWAFYLALLPLTSAAWAALIVGLVVWLLIGGGAWLAVQQLKKS
jgi:hypothetical protein